MNEIQALAQIDYLTIIVGIFIILFGGKEIIEIGLYFKKKLRLKTGLEADKETMAQRVATLEKHDKWQYGEITKISQGIEDIKNRLDEREEQEKNRTVATLRNQLYDLHNKFIERKSIDRSGLKTFLELGKIYEDAGGNDVYHDKLKPEVMDLPIED